MGSCVLTPGRFVGAEVVDEDEGEPFAGGGAVDIGAQGAVYGIQEIRGCNKKLFGGMWI